MKEQARCIYFDVIRIVACILVVCIHVSGMEFAVFEESVSSWFVLNVINCIGMNGVPLFFMLSGALMLADTYTITMKKLIGKVLKLGVLYYLVLFVYNLVPFLRGWVEWSPLMIKDCLIEGILYEGGVYHLWFLPVMILLYLLSPILKEAFNKARVCEYFLILFFCGEALLYTLTLFEYNGAIKRFVVYCQEKNSLFPLGAYIGYFVLGHYLHSFVGKVSRNKLLMIGIISILANIFTIITCYFDAVKIGYASSVANTPLVIGVLISSSGIFILMKNYCNNIQSEKKTKILRYIAGSTLGIYLIHPMVMSNVGFIQNMNLTIDNVFLLTIVRLICVTFISFIIVSVLKGVAGILTAKKKSAC